MQVKTILNAIQYFPGFVYHDIRLERQPDGRPEQIAITVMARDGMPARCARCQTVAHGCDRLPERSWLFVPLCGIMTWLVYAVRRVICPEHGVVVEQVPWSEGKRPVAIAMMCFLSRWAWRETARAWILKETFQDVWSYRSVTWAGYFLKAWTEPPLRSTLESMRKVARMLRSHEELLLNWFRAKGELSSGAVEGLNNKIRVVIRRSYGFRTYHAMEIALYHTLDRFPEPYESIHKFC